MKIFKTLQERYGFHKNAQLSMTQAENIVHAEASKTDEQRREWAKSVAGPINVATEHDRETYLRYAISLCEKGKKPLHTSLLRLKIRLASHPEFQGATKQQINKFIAGYLTNTLKIKVTPEQVEKYEKEAIDFVQQEIVKTKQCGFPLVGG